MKWFLIIVGLAAISLAIFAYGPPTKAPLLKDAATHECTMIVLLSKPAERHAKGLIDRAAFEHELRDFVEFGPRSDFPDKEAAATLSELKNTSHDSKMVAASLLRRLSDRVDYWAQLKRQGKLD